MILITVLIFIIIFSVLILVHEWGHFYFARRAGIKVEEFGIGLPPRAKKICKDKKGTIYSLNWIPFGGYVRLYGEDTSDPKVLKAKNSFAARSIWQRTQVIVAGVFMNFVLAWVLITVAMTVGMKPFLVTESDLEKAQQTGLIEMQEVLYIHEVVEGSPAGETDLLPGDLIVEIDGQTVPEAAALPEFLSPSQAVTLTILREDRKGQILLVTDEEGKLGLSLSDAPYILFKKDLRYPVYQAPFEAIKEVGRLSWLTLDMLGKVVTSVISKFAVPEGVAGPVGIARLTHHFTQQGVIALMQFMALLSISLGVINIMPFPALDGGRFLFIIFEIILRRRPNAKWEAAIHAVGFALLMLLILLITWNDVLSFF